MTDGPFMPDPARRLWFASPPAVLEHLPPPGHPERRERVESVLRVLRQSNVWERLTHADPPPATRSQLERVHSASMLDRIESLARQGGGLADAGDTWVSPGSWDAACAASGAALSAVDAVLTGDQTRPYDAAFACVRPPGHHATPTEPMGFCLTNHAAVAAAHAIAAHGLTRILLIDFDVHHGNGTQDAFYSSPNVLYVSTHQSPAYPGTGAVTETGAGAGGGYTVNIPLPADTDDAGFLAAFDCVVAPVADRFGPQLVIVSAGYDAHWRNSAYVAGIRERVTLKGLNALSSCVQQITDAHCPGKLVGILEGGYDLDALAYGVLGTLRVLLGDAGSEDDPLGPPPAGVRSPDISALLESIRTRHGLQ